MRLVWLKNGDGGGDDDFLRFYVAITISQIPLSKIDGVVNQFSMRWAKERDLIFSSCWQHCWARGFHFRPKSNFCAGRSPGCLASSEQSQILYDE